MMIHDIHLPNPTNHRAISNHTNQNKHRYEEIICAESSEALKHLIPQNCIDIIITSPPYNVAHAYQNYDDNIDFNAYLKQMKAIFKECYRVLKNGGRMCVNVPFAVKNKVSKEVRFLAVYMTQMLNEVGFKEFELISWHKGKDIRHFQGNNTAWGSWKSPSCPSFRPLGESVLVFFKQERTHKGDSKNIDIKSEEFKEWTKNLWYISDKASVSCVDKETNQIFNNVLFVSNNAKKDNHPAPFPEELVERLLKIYSYQNDIVLDPFNGTGTTSLVSAKLNRQFIGIELSLSYCEIAKTRLKSIDKDISINAFENLTNLVNSDNIKGTLNEIFPYKEAFSPHLIEYLAMRYNANIECVFDPFCGVGSSFLNPKTTHIYGLDISPFAISIAKAKLEKLDAKDIQKALKIAQSFNQNVIKHHDMPKWHSFSKYAKQEIYDMMMSFIESFHMLQKPTYHFIKYLVFANMDKIFDYKKDGNGIKFRASKITDCMDFLKSLCMQGIAQKGTFDKTNHKHINLFNASSISKKIAHKVDCVLTSPPYANLFDYFEIYKMELWASGLVANNEEWRKLKKSALRNNKNAALNPKDYIDNPILNATLSALESANLESSTISMLKNYFFDMKIVLNHCFEALKSGGFCFIVVGNSCYKAVPILTDEILSIEAQKLGFECKEILIARKLNTSSQQMKILNTQDKFFLRESIIVLQKSV